MAQRKAHGLKGRVIGSGPLRGNLEGNQGINIIKEPESPGDACLMQTRTPWVTHSQSSQSRSVKEALQLCM